MPLEAFLVYVFSAEAATHLKLGRDHGGHWRRFHAVLQGGDAMRGLGGFVLGNGDGLLGERSGRLSLGGASALESHWVFHG